MSQPRHPALAARILAAGLSTAAVLGIVAVLARDSQRSARDDQDPVVEIRVDAVPDDELRSSLAEWLEGRPALTDDWVDVVDVPADTASEPS
ncbi:MAG: hypothetical protein AAGF02_11610 [Actinomycetota bacterium]